MGYPMIKQRLITCHPMKINKQTEAHFEILSLDKKNNHFN